MTVIFPFGPLRPGEWSFAPAKETADPENSMIYSADMGVGKVDGKEVATQTMERPLPLIMQWDETFDIGSDTGTPVDDQDYQVPFRFTGTLNKLTLTIDRPKLAPEDEEKLMEAQRNNPVSQ